VYLMTGGGPYDSTQVLFTWAYQQAFTNFEFSYAAALASLIAVIVLALSVAEVQVLRRNPGG
jgi:ABC-type sugar transport system permease subunit